MTLKTERRDIDGLNVAVTQFAGRRNFGLLLDITRIVGPTLAAAGDQALKAKSLDDLMDADISLDRIGQVLFGSLDRPEIEKLVADLLSSTYVDDRPVNDQFDALFAGPALWKMPKIIAFVIKVNFGNFTALAASVSGVVGQRPGAGQASGA